MALDKPSQVSVAPPVFRNVELFLSQRGEHWLDAFFSGATVESLPYDRYEVFSHPYLEVQAETQFLPVLTQYLFLVIFYQKNQPMRIFLANSEYDFSYTMRTALGESLCSPAEKHMISQLIPALDKGTEVIKAAMRIRGMIKNTPCRIIGQQRYTGFGGETPLNHVYSAHYAGQVFLPLLRHSRNASWPEEAKLLWPDSVTYQPGFKLDFSFECPVGIFQFQHRGAFLLEMGDSLLMLQTRQDGLNF